MTQEPQKSNAVLIVIAIIGVIGTIVASAIGAIGNYNTEKMRQEAELTRIALVSIATQGGATQASMASTISAPTNTPYPTNELQPTYTPYPTYTPLPLPTIPPTASVSLPFSDTFDEGAKSDWQTIQGNWRMIDGQYTADQSNSWSIVTIGDAGWKNYTVDVDIYSYQRSAIRILLRYQNGSYIALETGGRQSSIGSSWILSNQGSSTVIAFNNAGGLNGGWAKYLQTHIQIEVKDSIYSAYSDGELLLRVQDSAFTSGGVGLAIQDYSVDNNTTRFDNFEVTPLP